ncbi:MAG: cytochrome c oxidase subunit II [Xanthobacteraceae bacterium]
MKLDQFATAASRYARGVDETFWILTALSTLIVLLLVCLVVIFMVRYRRGSDAPRGALPQFLQREIEVGWTVATFFLFMFFFWWAGVELLSVGSSPTNALEIHVVAKQWMFRFQQPSGAREIDEVHVPVGTPVRMVMTSEDVIHDLFIPALRIKMDILPDRYTYLSFTADRTGIFHLSCNQFCGTNHSLMGGQMDIIDKQDYARWTTAQPEGDDLAHQGAKLFHTVGCSGCHDSTGSTIHAPDLHGIYGSLVQLSDGRVVKANEAYLRDKILLPSRDIPAGYANDMPSFRGVVNEGQIVALIAYLKSLSAGTSERGGGQ